MRHVLPVLAAAALLPAAARADCIATPPGGTTYECLGFDPATGDPDPTPDGLSDTRDGLDVEVDLIVEDGPLVIDALRIPGAGNTVRVTGAIVAPRGAAIAGGPDLTVILGTVPAPGDPPQSALIEAGNGIDVGAAAGLTVDLAGGGDFDVSGTAIRGGNGAAVTGGAFFATGNYRAIDLGDDSTVTFAGDGAGVSNVAIGSGGGSAVKLGANSAFSIGAGGSILGRTSDDPLPGTGVEIVSGSFFSESSIAGRGAGGVGLRITGTGGVTTIDNGFEGALEGDDYAILVEGGDSNASVQRVVNFGSLGDVDLGGGNDEMRVADQMAFTGQTDLGAGMDLLTLVDTVDGLNGFGLFDGGAGFDAAVFEGFALADLLDLSEAGGILSFGFDEGLGLPDPTLVFELANFESYVFDDAAFTTTQLRAAFDLGPAVIPLPAAGWLLLAGLGGLALRRRRPAGA